MAYEYLTAAGVIVPDTADVLETVREEYRAALGDDLDTSDSTPQGLLIAAETAARLSVLRNNAALANQLNPDIAGGAFLDAVAALTRLNRQAATRSVLRGVVMTGQPGAILPAGAVARVGLDGAEFESVGAVALDAAGIGAVDFRCLTFGPVAVLAGALDTIVAGGVLGWETVRNPLAAEQGRNEQSDLSFRTQRRNTLALQGVSLSEAITSSLYALDGVTSLQYRENVTNAAAYIDGILLAAHSVWACVDGGTDAAIADALLRNKSLGADWNGATVVPVADPYSGQSYDVKFDRPEYVRIRVRVTVSQGTATANPVQDIPEALVAYADGDGINFGSPGLGVGNSVSPFELASAINIVYPGFYVRRVDIATDATAFGPNELVLALNQKATLVADDVTLVLA